MRLNLLAACAAVVVGGIASIGSAAALPVPDGGFEASNANNGWASNPSSGKWSINWSAGDWPGQDVYAAGAHGSPSEGVHFLQIYPGDAPVTGVPYGTFTLSGAAFPVTTTAGNTYSAAVDIVLAPDAGYPGSPSVTVKLMEGTNVLATGTGAVGATWSTVAVAAPFTATDSAVHNLSVEIVATNFLGDRGSWAGTNMNFDNVTVTETPEPAVLSLIGISSLGLLARRRK